MRTPDAPENVPGQVHLTKTEWAVLELLVRNPGRLVSGKQILHQIWGPSYHSQTNYLRFYLARLRQKLEPEPSHPRRLLTEPGVGYRFQPWDTQALGASRLNGGGERFRVFADPAGLSFRLTV